LKYIKKPVEVEAFQFGIDEFPNWFIYKINKNNVIIKDDCAYIKTLEGTMKAYKGDFIIKGVKGEIYPCKPDIFEQTYERI
jgi:hypothetical protein